ncbi:MAG: mevalonate kinase family protein [Bacteroidales bacterium]
MIIKSVSYPRAALIGNPSDGYFGKTIAFLFKNFRAEVILYESPELELMPAEFDSSVFPSMSSLVKNVSLFGYYGGIRLLKATIKRFSEYCVDNGIKLEEKNFTIKYCSDIPFRLGLAGSSAIITASMRALMQFYGVEIPRPKLANLVLSVETGELNISAGLQDRVAQAYETPVYMNFEESIMKRQGYGIYKDIPAKTFPGLYIAYKRDLSEGSEVVHYSFRERYNIREKAVIEAIEKWKKLSDQTYEALLKEDKERIGQLMNENFDIRRSVINISESNLQMIDTARKTGASAKFTGSGGAIIGTYPDASSLEELKVRLGEMGVDVIIPKIVSEQTN